MTLLVATLLAVPLCMLGCTRTSTSIAGPSRDISEAIIQFAASGSLSCVPGACTSLAWNATNVGPGCATGTQVVFRAFGSDGAPGAAQLGVDIPMALPGNTLATYKWPPGMTLTLVSISGFNDVRSAHTVFRGFESHTDVEC